MSTGRRGRDTQPWAPFPIQDWTGYARTSSAWRASRRTPRTALLVTVAMILLASSAFVLADLPARTSTPTGVSVHPYLPLSGSSTPAEAAEHLSGDGPEAGVRITLGSAILATPSATQSVPTALGSILLGATGMRLDRTIWRQTTAWDDHDEYQLWTASPQVRLLAVSHPSPRGFTDGVLVLPANPGPNQTWRSSGSVVLPIGAPQPRTADDGLRWRAEFSSRADPDPSCLAVEGELLIEGESTTTLSYRWCRGRGPVEQHRVDDQGSTRTVTVTEASPPQVRTESAPTSGSTDPAGWQTTSRMTVTDLPEVGHEASSGSPGTTLRETGSGRTVISSGTADVMVLDPLQDALVVRHRLFAGGWPVAVEVFGETVVVATSQRQLVSFDAASGAELWRVDLPDTTTATLHRIADRTIAVPLVNGELWAVDLVDGTRRWHQPVLASSAVPVAVAPGVVVVATRSGEVVALEATTGRIRWRHRPAAAVIDSVQTGHEAVWAFTDEGVFALDLATGELTGRRRGGLGTQVLALPEVTLFVRSGDEVLAVARDGSHQWRRPYACEEAVVQGPYLVCWDEGRVAAIDGTGAVVAERPVVEHLPGQLSVAVVADGVVWRANRPVDGTGAAWEVFTWRR